jgi:alpha-1,6-mannosyltransferase
MLSPRLVRWAGFGGAIATGVTAYVGGAGYTRGPSLRLGPMFGGDRGVLLPFCWVVGTALLVLAWWFGRRVVPSTRWALVTAGLWWVPVLPFLPLGSADAYAYACQGYVQFAGDDPYGAGVRSAGCPWLSSTDHVWQNSPAPYGPLFLLLAAAAVAVAGGSLAVVIGGLRVIALGGVALLAAGIPPLARRAGLDPGQAVFTVLACPLVLIHVVSGVHNDGLMAGLLVAGLALLTRRQTWPVLAAAGALTGLAVAVKATAIVVLPFVFLIRWRPTAAGFLVALGTVSLVAGRGLGWVRGLLHSGDTIAWTSPPTAAGLVMMWWRTWRSRADPLPRAGWALAATVVCAPVFQPWYAIWPLAVLAATRPATRWVLVPCAFAATLTLPAGYDWALQTRIPGAVFVLALGLFLLTGKGRRIGAMSGVPARLPVDDNSAKEGHHDERDRR